LAFGHQIFCDFNVYNGFNDFNGLKIRNPFAPCPKPYTVWHAREDGQIRDRSK
jgi:hypothetical protein